MAFTNYQGKFKKDLQELFRGYKNVTPKMETKLNDMGFNFVRSHHHYVLEYMLNDKKFVFIMAKTPSDGRSGLNLASKICQTLTQNSF